MWTCSDVCDPSLPQVSSYGGHLRYELHSDPRRGDVFIPMESRPDVILKVQPEKFSGDSCYRERDEVVTDTFLAVPREIR